MTPLQFRRIALGHDGVVEGAHMGHADFRAANGRIFASLTEDEKRGTAKLTPEQQADFVDRAPKAFIPAAGAWGRQGWTTIVLKDADQEMLGEALTLAWQSMNAAKPARKRPKTRKSAKS